MKKIPIIDLDNNPALHHALAGKQIDYVATDGAILVLRTTEGTELQVAWVDDNGIPIKGKPAIRFCGTNILVKTGAVGVAARR